jgi:hypothetical protein
MPLSIYRQQTKQLLTYPDSPDELYTDSDLNLWINRARQQLAGESQSIRVLGTVTTSGVRGPYTFSTVMVSSTPGVAAVLHIRAMRYAIGSGFKWMRPRNWEWFDIFKLNNVVPPSGPPQVWSQYGQGSTGSFYIDPIPALEDGSPQNYVLTCDCVCLPVDLLDDTTVDAIPPLWQDAVCFYAAFLAMLSAQSAQRQNDADRMMQRYEEFVGRARKFANPLVNNYLYQQSNDPTLLNKIGLSPKAGAGA